MILTPTIDWVNYILKVSEMDKVQPCRVYFNTHTMLQFVYEVYEQGDKVSYVPTYRITTDTREEALDWISREGTNHTMFTIKEVIIKSQH